MIYKNKYFATIEPELFNSLEQTIKNHDYHYDKSDSNRIMMDKAVFLIDYIRYQKSIRKDDILTNGFIRIPSKLLNVFLKKELKKYKDFLKYHNYIATIPYDKDKSISYGYKVIFKNLKSVKSKEYEVYEFLSLTYEKFLVKSLTKEIKIEQKKKSADRTTSHLTKWINPENIQVDWESGFSLISESKELSDEQKQQYSYSLNAIRFHQWYYLRSTNDNRLHSNLTNLPSLLRAFLSHKGQKLVSLDIKSSQPYMLAGILNLIINTRVKR